MKTGDFPKGLKRDLRVIDGSFVSYLRQRHSSEFTIGLYRRFLRKVARYLSKRGRSASRLRLRDVPAIIGDACQGGKRLHASRTGQVSTNRSGEPLSRDGVSFRLALAARKCRATLPLSGEPADHLPHLRALLRDGLAPGRSCAGGNCFMAWSREAAYNPRLRRSRSENEGRVFEATERTEGSP